MILTRGGNGSRYNDVGGGGGAGGRISMYFKQNKTFSEFRYLSNGGWPGLVSEISRSESGGPGTVFIYHTGYDHRTLIVDNNGAPLPNQKYVNWEDKERDGARAWILPISGLNDFAFGSYQFAFEELQIYGNAHLAFHPPTVLPSIDVYNPAAGPSQGISLMNGYNLTVFFKYMIGDRTGSVHVAGGQILDLERDEIDLPYNCYVYGGGYLGLAYMTFVHGVEIHLSGVLANVENLTLHHGGYLWLKDGGHTLNEPDSQYMFEFVRIQDEGIVNATTDPVEDEGITFFTRSISVEGGGVLHGTHMTFHTENITIDAGGLITSEGLGYRSNHISVLHDRLSVHGPVNPGRPPSAEGVGAGGGHGGSGGHSGVTNSRSGFAYGNIYEPDRIGSSGGFGAQGALGGSGGGLMWLNVTDTIYIDGELSARGGDADVKGGGGGSGGSVWLFCRTITGYGKITAHGGDGSKSSSSPGGGGAGGRIAMYFMINETFTSFSYEAFGGKAGNEMVSENGGGGTVFIYHMWENHTTLLIDNGGRKPRDKLNVIKDYNNLQTDSCRTWILPESGTHYFAGGGYKYSFNELQIYGDAHLAILPEPVGTPVDVFFLYMIGDRSGTVHLSDKQVMDLERPEIDLPFSVRAYTGSYIGLAPFTIIHNVSIWLHGSLDHVENMTLHHNGLLSLEHGGHTEGLEASHFEFRFVRIQHNSTIWAITDPVTEIGINYRVDHTMFIEGGGTFRGANVTIEAHNIIIDCRGTLIADGLGYRPKDTPSALVNLGIGQTAPGGSSGGGHGGTSGRGGGTELTGRVAVSHQNVLCQILTFKKI